MQNAFLGFLCCSTGKDPPVMWEAWVRSRGWEDPLKKEMATHSSILAWRIHEQRNLEGYILWGRKESYTTERLRPFFFFSLHAGAPSLAEGPLWPASRLSFAARVEPHSPQN